MLREQDLTCPELGETVGAVTVVLCVSRPIPRAGLKVMLDGVAGLQVVAVTDDIRKMERFVRSERPDVAVLDGLGKDPNDLLRLVEELRAEDGGTAYTLIVPDRPDPELLAMAHAAGIRSFLSAHDLMSDVVSAVHRPVLLARRAGTPSLTPRERDVLPLVASGWTDREIGDRLNLAERSVKYQISNLLAKFHARNRAHLVYLSVRASAGRLNRPNDTGQLAG